MDQKDRARFDRALAKLLFATNGTAKTTSTVATTYWTVLKQFDWLAVASGMTAALSESTGHVSPATLANFCRPAPGDVMNAAGDNRAHELEARLASADAKAEMVGETRFGKLWFDSEFRDVLRVANMDYARRCSGKIPGGVRIPTPDLYGYDGPFDLSAVVKAMTLPKGKRPDDQSAAWECFWCVLAEEFTKYQEAL